MKKLLSHILPFLIFAVLAAGSTDTDDGSSSPSTSPPEDNSWVPEGFSRFNRNVAVKWSPDGSYSCSHRRCAQLEVVANKDCENLYGEATKIDSAGNNVGYTNNTLKDLKTGQKSLLMFDTYGDFESFELAKISCY